MKIPEFKRSGIRLIAEFRRIPNGFPNQDANNGTLVTATGMTRLGCALQQKTAPSSWPSPSHCSCCCCHCLCCHHCSRCHCRHHRRHRCRRRCRRCHCPRHRSHCRYHRRCCRRRCCRCRCHCSKILAATARTTTTTVAVEATMTTAATMVVWVVACPCLFVRQHRDLLIRSVTNNYHIPNGSWRPLVPSITHCPIFK